MILKSARILISYSLGVAVQSSTLKVKFTQLFGLRVNSRCASRSAVTIKIDGYRKAAEYAFQKSLLNTCAKKLVIY